MIRQELRGFKMLDGLSKLCDEVCEGLDNLEEKGEEVLNKIGVKDD